MSDELRAAAQRWVERCKQPVTEPEWDAIRVAQAYLAEHPADDAAIVANAVHSK